MTQTTPSTIAALCLAGFLAFAAIVPVGAADPAPCPGAECIEVTDAEKDVNPAAVAQTLPPEAALVEHMELYDIVSADAFGESSDSFFIKIVVSDIPANWILQPGPAGGDPVPPIQLSTGHEVTWDDSLMNSKVNLTAYFIVKGKTYRAVATLAELNLENPNQFPAVNSKQLIDGVLADARLKLAEQDAALQSLVNDEVKKKLQTVRGEIDKAHALVNTTYNGDTDEYRDEIDTAFDTARAQLDAAEALIPAATLTDALKKGFQELDKKVSEAQLLAAGLPGATVAGTGSVNPNQTPSIPQSPKVLLFHRFVLIDDQGKHTALAGAISGESDSLQMQIPKDKVGSPAKGDRLTGFRVESSFKSAYKMDFAPDAANPSPGDSALGLVSDAASGQLVKPVASAHWFEFAYEAPSPAEAPDLRLSPVGPSHQTIQPGGVATYLVTARNAGSMAIEGAFSLSPAPGGWTHEISDASFALPAGASMTVTLSVSGVEGASSSLASLVHAVVEGGDTESLTFTTSLQLPDDDSNEDDEDQEDQSDEGGEDDSGGGGSSPGLEAVGVLAALAALVVVLRRRVA